MKIGLVSLGCPKNLVDSEVMLGLAQEAGHELTPRADEADVLIVNTCAFIDKAKQESIDTILELAEHKKTGACRRLVVTGCLAERYRDELRELIPEVDVVLGTGEVPEIVNALDRRAGGARGRDGAPLASRLRRLSAGDAQALDARPARSEPQWRRGIVSAVAHARAADLHLRSRDASRADDAAALRVHQDRGRLRLQLRLLHHPDAARAVSQPVGRVDRRRGARARRARREGAAAHLAGLDVLRHRSPGTRRACPPASRARRRRRHRLDPPALPLSDDDHGRHAIEAIAASDKVCRYIDLPLQHAAPSVLRRMRRPGARESYEKLLGRIRERLPEVTLRTTLIVGFPGETEEEFEELCAFVKAVEFDHVGVFTYSHEEGTAAYALTDDVPAGVKRKRRNKVMAIQKAIVARKQRAPDRPDGRASGGRPVEGARPGAPGPPRAVTPRISTRWSTSPTATWPTSRPDRSSQAEIVDARDYDLGRPPGATGSGGSARDRVAAALTRCSSASARVIT